MADGQPPATEPLDAKTAAQPLLIGADGVMAPFRREEGTPKGRTLWREVKVAIGARRSRGTTRIGEPAPPLERRRLVAVLGDLEALRPRLWLEATRQGICQAQVVVWLSDDFNKVIVTELFGALAAMDEAEQEVIELTAHIESGKLVLEQPAPLPVVGNEIRGDNQRIVIKLREKAEVRE